MIVPARANSSRVPHKNKMIFGGKPSIVHTLDALDECQWVESVVVVSDDVEIRGLACRHGVQVMKEPAVVAKSDDLYDVAYFVMQHIDEEFDAVGFAYPNVPVRPDKLFDLLIDTFIAEEHDSVAAVCEENHSGGGSVFSWEIMQAIIADRGVLGTYREGFIEFSRQQLVEIDTENDVAWARLLLTSSAPAIVWPT